MPSPQLSVVIPTFGGEKCLRPLLTRLEAVLDQDGRPFEIIVVNDASPDESWRVLDELSHELRELRVIELLSNHGQPTATMCGLSFARGELVATMDDDLQHPPEELPKLIRALEEHPRWDAVVGSWPRDQGLMRSLGSWIHEVVDAIGYGTPRGFRHTSFRVIRRPAVDSIVSHLTRRPLVGRILMSAVSEVHNVQVRHDPRHEGRSGFTLRQGIRRVWTNFAYGTAMPLRLLNWFGGACAALAVFLGIFYFTRWMIGYATPIGWASTFLAIVFFGGAGLFGLGLLGEYMYLLVQEVRQPPRWSVRRIVEPPASEVPSRPAES
jgi:dolichol-phosphate mannosyltransferase/undecaprenyl-phosphate 4-deoxy-4-formamido-L-arabinose transferase